MREGVRVPLPHSVAEAQPVPEGVVLDETEMVRETLGVPVGVAY